MKKIIPVMICFIVGLLAYQIRSNNNHNATNQNMSSHVLANIDAIMNPEVDLGGDSSTNPNPESGENSEGSAGEKDTDKLWPYQKSCLDRGGNWNMASICKDGGIVEVVCQVDGQISLLGITLSSTVYLKGHKYPITWALYTCIAHDGNCCETQGMFINEH